MKQPEDNVTRELVLPRPVGGKRKGAGRPALGVKRTQVLLDAETIDFLREVGGGNVSAGIRLAALALRSEGY